MAGINVAQVVAELGNYIVQKQEEVRSWVYQNVEYLPYVNTIVKVNGEYPAYLGVMSNVVQEFASVWNELGEAIFKAKKLIAFKQKVNFPIIPADLQNSWLSFLYTEGLTPEQMPISQWIMMELAKKVNEDIDILGGTGVYTPGTGLFGDSMDGVLTILADMLATGNPFKVPLPALTDANIVGCVDAFERMLPNKVGREVKAIFMSRQNLQRYKLRYRTLYGGNNDFDKADTAMTWLGGRMVVGFSSWDGSDTIMATADKNWVRLIDIIDAPRITDVQKDDYKVKVFMEFTLGYQFWADELTFVSDYVGTTRGLGTDHTVYYPETPTTAIAPL